MPELKSKRPTYTADYVHGDTRNAVFLGNPVMDNLVHAVVALGAELWAVKRRVKITESLFARHQAVTRDMIEAYVPTADEEKAWAAERDQMIKATYGVFANPEAIPHGSKTSL